MATHSKPQASFPKVERTGPSTWIIRKDVDRWHDVHTPTEAEKQAAKKEG